MNAAPYPICPVRLSPAARAEKEAAALLGRPGVWSMMLGTFLLCALLLLTPFITADCFYTFLTLSALDDAALHGIYVALNLLAAALTVLVVLPVWLGRLRLCGALFAGEDVHPREVFYYLTNPRRWGRALAVLLLLVALLAVPMGLTAGLFALCRLAYDALAAEIYEMAAAFIYMILVLFATGAIFAVLPLFAVCLPFAAVAVGNEDMRLSAALGISFRAAKRNFGACTGFLCKSFLRLLLGILTVGVLQILWNTHLFLLSYTRLSMALCPKGEPQ